MHHIQTVREQLFHQPPPPLPGAREPSQWTPADRHLQHSNTIYFTINFSELAAANIVSHCYKKKQRRKKRCRESSCPFHNFRTAKPGE